MVPESDFLVSLNGEARCAESAEYTNFYSSFDEFVLPIENATMEYGANNVKVQSQCRGRFVEHLGFLFDPAVYAGIRSALEHRPIILCGPDG